MRLPHPRVSGSLAHPLAVTEPSRVHGQLPANAGEGGRILLLPTRVNMVGTAGPEEGGCLAHGGAREHVFLGQALL